MGSEREELDEDNSFRLMRFGSFETRLSTGIAWYDVSLKKVAFSTWCIITVAEIFPGDSLHHDYLHLDDDEPHGGTAYHRFSRLVVSRLHCEVSRRNFCLSPLSFNQSFLNSPQSFNHSFPSFPQSFFHSSPNFPPSFIHFSFEIAVSATLWRVFR